MHWGDIYPQFLTPVHRHSSLPKRPPLFYQAGPSPLVLQNSCNTVFLSKGYRRSIQATYRGGPCHKRTDRRIPPPHVTGVFTPGDYIGLMVEIALHLCFTQRTRWNLLTLSRCSIYFALTSTYNTFSFITCFWVLFRYRGTVQKDGS